MAAKPPKPPGHSINSNNNNKNNNNKNRNNDPLTQNIESVNNINNNNNTSCNRKEGKVSNIEYNNSNETHGGHDLYETDATPPKPTCHCSNISIMHLFHEMKQEFPTIPDQIVAQCVNENCHHREKCILMLRNELALNPIPAQTYPAKVLQRQQQQQKLQQRQQQQHQHHHHQEHVAATPLKPVRVAPPISISACDANPSLNPFQTGAATKNSIACNNQSHTNGQSKTFEKQIVEISESVGNCAGENFRTDITDTTTRTSRNQVVNSSQSIVSETPRMRPTTLDLNLSQQQKKQQQKLRQQLNVQLQQHLQQRQTAKPVASRKAPLPPLPPKPSQLINHQYTSGPSAARTPQHSSNTSLSSPVSSGESEISVNVGSLSSPTSAAAGATPGSAALQHPQHNQLKSPKRHRSVINVQPEPPYSRDFLVSPSSSSGGSSSQKSFTSVNLTLRQPNASAAQSTIDISAGPAVSGASPGLTYSSTSYDARRGYQKNFHITVSDEGGVFSASRIRPHGGYNPVNEQELNGVNGSGVSRLRSAATEQDTQIASFTQQKQQRIVTTENSEEMRLYQMRIPNGLNEILHRQTTRRDKLSAALRDNKKRLSQVEQEINVLTEPMSPSESERLDSEIQRLRCDCEVMLNEIENSKQSGLSIANSPSHPSNSMNSRQQQISQPFPRQRPPRPQITAAGCQPLDFVQHHVVSSTPSSALSSPNQQQLPPLLPTYQQLQHHYQQQLRQQQLLLQQHQQQQSQQQQHQLQLQPSTDEEDYSDSNTDGGDEEDNAGLEMWACSMCTFRNHPQLNICECCENVRILPGTIRIIPSGSSTQPPASLLLSQLSASSASSARHASASPLLTRSPSAALTTNSPAAVATASGNPSSLEGDANLPQQQPKQFALHTAVRQSGRYNDHIITWRESNHTFVDRFMTANARIAEP